MSLHSGERQVAQTVDGIRRDHVARYEWAARTLPPGSEVLDLGCGVGYGAKMLADAGHKVTAIDRDGESIEFAKQHYAHPSIRFERMDADAIAGYVDDAFDAVTCFEFIEHVADPLPVLRDASRLAELLLASVPNEEVFPFRNYAFHHRHYRPGEFLDLLLASGYGVESWWGQGGPRSDVEPNVSGRTLVALARRGAASISSVSVMPIREAAPEHVVILGLGPSLESYVDRVKRMGGRHAFADEVWGVNAVGGVLQCDRVFHMDDVRIQEIRAAAQPQSNIARMLEWLRKHPGPVYTSRPHPDYPGLVAYPLQDVVNSCGWSYFNSTVAYAVAYAVHIGVKQISLFGLDFTYADSHKSEKGRGCVEFHLGIAAARGIKIGFPENTSLMDSIAPIEERIYGYDTLELDLVGGEDDGPVEIRMTPRERFPTAEEIEQRYDHNRSPNPLMRQP